MTDVKMSEAERLARELRLETQYRADGSPWTHTDRLMHDAAAELRRLAAEVEALRPDAERYRWVRGNCECMGANADAAIDAAKAKGDK